VTVWIVKSGRLCGYHGQKENACKILVRKYLGRSSEDNIKMNINEMGCEVHRSGAGSRPMAGFGISGTEMSGSATTHGASCASVSCLQISQKLLRPLSSNTP
jgi:hypothetical protein